MNGDTLAPFDDLYRSSPDPWGTDSRWYEARKRTLLLAALPRERYATAYEPGCGTGHISVELAERCDALLAADGVDEAVAITSRRLAGHRHARVERHRLPDDFPRQPFDLVVLSEVLYFVDTAQCEVIAASARASAGGTGTIVACDWRATIEGRGHSGDDVHRRFERALDLPRLFEYVDPDFVLTGWSADTTTVAMREGLR